MWVLVKSSTSRRGHDRMGRATGAREVVDEGEVTDSTIARVAGDGEVTNEGEVIDKSWCAQQ